jgi:uncharacterized protein YajQ (UPF0234 family)
LQTAMALVKQEVKDIPLSFTNFRDWTIKSEE